MLSGERRQRLRSAALILVSGMFAFATVLLIPSAIALIAAKESGKERLETTRRLIELQEHTGAVGSIAETKEKMDLLRQSEMAVGPRKLIERIAPLLPSGVTLSDISFTRDGGTIRLDLSGEASNRAALIAFGDELRSSGLFASVVIPIESLAQSTDLQFRLSLSLAEEALSPQ
jgi:hypothetical protein